MGNRRIQSNKKKRGNEAPHTGVHKAVVLMAYIYLALPIIIFLLGWCRFLIGVPLAGVCVWSLVRSFRRRENYIELDGKPALADKWRLVVIAAVIFAWVALSGVGGYIWQNGDHAWRNRILQILVEYEWPPTAGERGLVYYVGTWLPAALVGRMLDLDEAHTALFVWVLLGMFLVYALICIWRRKIVLWPLLILIFFSGLDVIGSCVFTEDAVHIFGSEHLEWWAPRQLYELQYSSNTTQLCWVFNQSVPVWLAMMLLFMDEPPKNMIWLGSLVAITSTLPFIGMLPILIYYIFRRCEWYRPESVAMGWKMVLGNISSFQNLAGGVLILLLSFLYLMGNDNFTNVSAVGADGAAASSAALPVWFPWIFLLGGALTALLLGTLVLWGIKQGKGYVLRNTLYTVLTIVLIVLLFRVLGTERTGKNGVSQLVFTIFFVLLEAGIYLYLLFRNVEDKSLFAVVAISLMVIPFIRIGSAGDFCMRASIPGLFVVMLWCMDTLGRKRMNLRIVTLLICLILGAVTPLHEMKRALINSYTDYAIETVEDERIMNAPNFSGSLDTFFWRYIARQK